jgi:hypothetical protein
MHMIKFAVPVMALAMTSGCVITSTKTETRTYQHTGFDSIAATSGVNVILKQGPYSVVAETPEGKLDSIEISQQGNELRLSRKPELTFFSISGRYVVHVATPTVTSISVSGGADLDADGLTADALTLSASGGGDMRLTTLRIGTLTASTSGGGDINISGACQSATVEAGGGGDFSGKHLDCANAVATASGGGDIEIGATQSATGKASSGGDITFVGAPPVFNKDASSGGDISLKAP